MPEDVDTEGGSPEGSTISDAEYKKLQRKLNRRDQKAKASEREMAEMRSAINRLEEMTANVLHLSTLDDESVRSDTARKVIRDMATRRPQDITSAQVEADVSQVLDEADADWSDERLTEARMLHEEMSRTGNVELGQEVLRKAREALMPSQSASSTEEIEAIVAAAILKDRQESGRVDVGVAAHTGERTRRNDLTGLDPRHQTIAQMRAIADKAADDLQK